MRRLNREFRGKDATTDVLSFPAGDIQASQNDGTSTGDKDRSPVPLPPRAGDIAISLARARAQARRFGHSTEREIRILMLHGVLHLLGMDHANDGGRMARAEKRWRDAPGPAGGPDRAGAAMMLAMILAALVAIPLLGLVTFVQLLYLESMRLRTRDLPALEFFKDTLEDKLGLKTEDGAGAFSLIKHTLLVLLGIFYFAWFAGERPMGRGGFLAGRAGGVAGDDRGGLRAAAAALPPHVRPLAAAAGSAAARPGAGWRGRAWRCSASSNR